MSDARGPDRHPLRLGDGPEPPPAPRNPAARPPARRPGSVRRTSSIDMTWPAGWGTPLHLLGRARDLLTPLHGEPAVLAFDAMWARIGTDRTIEAIRAEPDRPAIRQVVGARGGGKLRSALTDALPEERRSGSPLWLLVDDIAGASLVAGFAWSRHLVDWPRAARGDGADGADGGDTRPGRRPMEGICAGFRPGSSALAADGSSIGGRHNVAPVPPLTDPEDPVGWHELDPLPGVSMRRARRIDVWVDSGQVLVDAMFRDSTREPDGTEVAVHEYRIEAAADAGGVLGRVVAEPRVLPYPECPAAAPNVDWLVGQPMADLRARVIEVLRGPDCCTHLNDALRSMAEVPVLARAIGEDGRV